MHCRPVVEREGSFCRRRSDQSGHPFRMVVMRRWRRLLCWRPGSVFQPTIFRRMDALLAAPIGAIIIFALRIVDVSMGTMRLILGVRGYRGRAAAIGFFEVLIWLFAVGAVLQHLTSVIHIVGYAGGFAAGNFVGIWLEGQFALGINVVRATFRCDSDTGEHQAHRAAETLRDAGFAVTELEGRGREHPVHILNIVTERKRVDEVIRIVHASDDHAFVTVEEVRTTRGGYFRSAPGGFGWLGRRR